MFFIACFRLSVIASLLIFANFSFTSSLAPRVVSMTSVLALSLLSFSIRAFTSGSGCAGRFLMMGAVGLSAVLWAALRLFSEFRPVWHRFYRIDFRIRFQ